MDFKLTALVSILRDKGILNNNDIEKIVTVNDLIALLGGSGEVKRSDVLEREVNLRVLLGKVIESECKGSIAKEYKEFLGRRLSDGV